jgi:hypothetical protein
MCRAFDATASSVDIQDHEDPSYARVEHLQVAAPGGPLLVVSSLLGTAVVLACGDGVGPSSLQMSVVIDGAVQSQKQMQTADAAL